MPRTVASFSWISMPHEMCTSKGASEQSSTWQNDLAFIVN